MTDTPLVVFSDLDGTLLDHDTYDWSAARPALDMLKRMGAPVILCSSKTAPEITLLQEDMGLAGLPAIVENGSGTIGLGAAEDAPAPYGRLRAVLDGLPEALRAGFTGFGDMTDAGVAEVTGLSLVDAARARDRRFSEPGLWQGSDAARADFLTALARAGVQGREGGRFLTLSFGRTKADAMDAVLERYKPRHTIALGDAPNDLEMIAKAAHGVIIANPHRSALPVQPGEREGRIRRTSLPGPEGWNLAVREIVEELNLE